MTARPLHEFPTALTGQIWNRFHEERDFIVYYYRERPSLRGAVEIWTEDYDTDPGPFGEEILKAAFDTVDWDHLEKLFKDEDDERKCERCNGLGEVHVRYSDQTGEAHGKECPDCDGTGRVWP